MIKIPMEKYNRWKPHLKSGTEASLLNFIYLFMGIDTLLGEVTQSKLFCVLLKKSLFYKERILLISL